MRDARVYFLTRCREKTNQATMPPMAMVLVALALCATPDAGSPPRLEAPDPVELFERLAPSIVRIDTETGFGSGVVVSRDLVATNAHVVLGAKNVVVLQGTERWTARVTSIDQGHDVALVEVSGLRRPSPARRKVATLKTGERVYALGNPLGENQTFSDGLISQVRAKPATGSHEIQFTAPISNGSSGGGLFDRQGRLIGLTTSMAVSEGAVAQNLNFAVATDWVEELMKAPAGETPAPVRGTEETAPTRFTITARPEALSCRLFSRKRIGVFPSGMEVLGAEPDSGTLYVLSFDGDVAQLHRENPTSRAPIELVLSDLSRKDQQVQFSRTDGEPEFAQFILDSATNLFTMQYLTFSSIRSQPRVDLLTAVCEPGTTAGLTELARRTDAQRMDAAQQSAADAGARAEACDHGHPSVCIELASESNAAGDTPQAALLYRKACHEGRADGCAEAYKLYVAVGSEERANEVYAEACRLKRCPDTAALPVPTVQGSAPTIAPPKAIAPPRLPSKWKSLQTGGTRELRVAGDTMYVEVDLPPWARRQGALSSISEFHKSGPEFVGQMHFAMACQFRSGPFRKVNTKSCNLTLATGITSISPSRIEGWFDAPEDLDCENCSVGAVRRTPFTLIPAE